MKPMVSYLAVLSAAGVATLAPASPAVAAPGDYDFAVVADSVADDLDPVQLRLRVDQPQR